MFVKPRKVRTKFGEFGCQPVSDVHVDAKEILVQTLLDRSYADCVKTTYAPVKDAIRMRLETGEVLPGCTLRVEENDPVFKIASALLQAAVKEARGRPCYEAMLA